jgi:potassium channel subfamily T protein 1
LIRPSPFSAQKTFERHNSRRKSNISFCGAVPGNVGGNNSNSGGGGFPPRPPPLSSKSNSLSLPESPTLQPGRLCRSRSNSLRVDDILLRRSSSLRQGLSTAGLARQRRKSSLEDVGLALLRPPTPAPIKIALNGSIGLEVTPPDESDHNQSGLGISGGGGSSSNINNNSGGCSSSSGSQQQQQQSSIAAGVGLNADPQHLQGTIV